MTNLINNTDEMTGAGFIFVSQIRSKGIAASWTNPEVKAARTARHAVEVDGVRYESVRKAFTALGLPDCKHIKFRGDLKLAGEGVFEGHDFVLVAA